MLAYARDALKFTDAARARLLVPRTANRAYVGTALIFDMKRCRCALQQTTNLEIHASVIVLRIHRYPDTFSLQ